MAPGGEKTNSFRTMADRLHFLEVLTEALERYEVRLFVYVLTDTRYHLALQTRHPNLSRFIHYLNTSYTVWMNKHNRRRGNLPDSRYRSIVIENGGYLLFDSVRTNKGLREIGEPLGIKTADVGC